MQVEKQYIQSLIFEHFLGIQFGHFSINVTKKYFELVKDQRKLRLSNAFFGMEAHDYLTKESLPFQPLEKINFSNQQIFVELIDKEVPIIYGDNELILSDSNISLGIDILGSCFFMLTRYEEHVKNDRDQHDRFPASASLAFQEGFLERPIVDEYVEILWCCMQYLWPDLKRKKRTFKKEISCDVDWPYSITFNNVNGISKRSIGNLVKRKSISKFVSDIRRYMKVQSYGIRYDEFYQFPFIMDELERRDLKGTFYFIADNPAGDIDGIYQLDEPDIQSLLSEVVEREHRIGLHPSYTTYQNSDQIAKEKNILECHLAKFVNESKVTLTRQHFLRLDSSRTFRLLSENGFKFDSSMGYPDHIGFRAGTCQAYQMFDINSGHVIEITQLPLLVMEVSMLSSSYMALSHDEALDRVSRIVDHCRYHQGNFTFLWHNNQFYNRKDFELYSNILDL